MRAREKSIEKKKRAGRRMAWECRLRNRQGGEPGQLP